MKDYGYSRRSTTRLMVLFCAALCSGLLFATATTIRAQERAALPEARVVERLPDGEFIVQIDNTEQRTITAEHARRIAGDKVDLQAALAARANLERQNAALQRTLDLTQRDAQLAATQAALERERAGRFSAMYEGERGLREQAERLAPRPSRLTRFLDHPLAQIGFRVAVPTLNTLLAAK